MNTPHLTGGVRQVQHLHGSDHRPWLGHTCISAVNNGHKGESSKTSRVKLTKQKLRLLFDKCLIGSYRIYRLDIYSIPKTSHVSIRSAKNREAIQTCHPHLCNPTFLCQLQKSCQLIVKALHMFWANAQGKQVTVLPLRHKGPSCE